MVTSTAWILMTFLIVRKHLSLSAAIYLMTTELCSNIKMIVNIEILLYLQK